MKKLVEKECIFYKPILFEQVFFFDKKHGNGLNSLRR